MILTARSPGMSVMSKAVVNINPEIDLSVLQNRFQLPAKSIEALGKGKLVMHLFDYKGFTIESGFRLRGDAFEVWSGYIKHTNIEMGNTGNTGGGLVIRSIEREMVDIAREAKVSRIIIRPSLVVNIRLQETLGKMGYQRIGDPADNLFEKVIVLNNNF